MTEHADRKLTIRLALGALCLLTAGAIVAVWVVQGKTPFVQASEVLTDSWQQVDVFGDSIARRAAHLRKAHRLYSEMGTDGSRERPLGRASLTSAVSASPSTLYRVP